MKQKTYTYKNKIECPKSAKFPAFIKELAWDMEVNIVKLDIIESGWIFKKQLILFEIKSHSITQMNAFVKKLHETIDEHTI